MHKKSVINLVIILFMFIVLHNAIIIGLSNVFTVFRENNKDELTIKSYEQKIEILEREISGYKESLNNLSIYEGSSYILSKIALRDIYDFFDILTISTDTQVKKGSAVVNEHGLVGVVKDSNKNTAQVSLLTGKNDLSIKVEDSFGLVESYDKIDNLLIAKNINNYAKIEEGALVTTSGLQKIDAGIKVGTVERTEVVGVEKIVYIKPFVDFSNLNYLMVIDK